MSALGRRKTRVLFTPTVEPPDVIEPEVRKIANSPFLGTVTRTVAGPEAGVPKTFSETLPR